MINPVIIFGTSDLAWPAYNIFMTNDIPVYGFLDNDESKHGNEIGIAAVLGSEDDQGYLKLIGKKCDAFIASTEATVRKALVGMLNAQRKVMPANAIHPSAVIAGSATVSYGHFINAHTTVSNSKRVHLYDKVKHAHKRIARGDDFFNNLNPGTIG
jgi:hypothetical protein